MARNRLIALIVGLGILAAGCFTVEQGEETGGFDSIASHELPTAADVRSSVGHLSLPDVARDGEAFSLKAAPGEVLVVYFGFTFCPDVCPTTLADLRQALADLGGDARSVDVAMITVDPERDTPDVLAGYLEHFVEGAHPLRTSDEAMLRAVGDAFGAEFSVVKTADGGVEVLHTAYLYAVDEEGSIVATWPFGAESEAIAADLRLHLG